MRNKEQSDAITSGQYSPKLPGLGRAPTSGVCGLWPQRHCLPFSETLLNVFQIASEIRPYFGFIHSHIPSQRGLMNFLLLLRKTHVPS